MSKVNRHGRKPGRGIRPWLLAPKVVAVAVYFGSAFSAAGLWFARPDPFAAKPDPWAAMWIEPISLLVRFVMVPALLTAIVLGAGLFAQHAPVFVRQRWFQVKLATIVVFIPAMHLFMWSRLARLREAMLDPSQPDRAVEWQITAGFVVLLVGSFWVIFLGRHKPRLWQSHASRAGRAGA